MLARPSTPPIDLSLSQSLSDNALAAPSPNHGTVTTQQHVSSEFHAAQPVPAHKDMATHRLASARDPSIPVRHARVMVHSSDTSETENETDEEEAGEEGDGEAGDDEDVGGDDANDNYDSHDGNSINSDNDNTDINCFPGRSACDERSQLQSPQMLPILGKLSCSSCFMSSYERQRMTLTSLPMKMIGEPLLLSAMVCCPPLLQSKIPNVGT